LKTKAKKYISLFLLLSQPLFSPEDVHLKPVYMVGIIGNNRIFKKWIISLKEYPISFVNKLVSHSVVLLGILSLLELRLWFSYSCLP
jgi:hypothetical protein